MRKENLWQRKTLRSYLIKFTVWVFYSIFPWLDFWSSCNEFVVDFNKKCVTLTKNQPKNVYIRSWALIRFFLPKYVNNWIMPLQSQLEIWYKLHIWTLRHFISQFSAVFLAIKEIYRLLHQSKWDKPVFVWCWWNFFVQHFDIQQIQTKW